MTKALMVQGTTSGSGKTTLVTALCRIFSNMGYSVSPFKAQNMSSFTLRQDGFEISMAQAIQAIASRSQISWSINPILLKPLGNYYSDVIVRGKFYKKMLASEYYQKFAIRRGIKIVKSELDCLFKSNDLVIIEGAGSPAEFNLERYDIANMRIAEHADIPVLLISDIERGGCFASIVGTFGLLKKRHKHLIKGCVINKFRGDAKILEPSIKKLEKKIKVPVIGTLPRFEFGLPPEDSLDHTATDKSPGAPIDYENEIEKLSKMVKDSLDIDSILEIMRNR